MKKISASVMITTSLAGCVSILPHYKFSDSAVSSQAYQSALARTCAERGFTRFDDVFAFDAATRQLQTVADYNENLYETTYKSQRAKISANLSAEHETLCEEVSKALPGLTREMQSAYTKVKGDRNLSLREMTGSMPSSTGGFGQTNSFVSPSIQIPKGEATFGLSKNQNKNYLIDAGNERRLCTATPSGYVNCM